MTTLGLTLDLAGTLVAVGVIFVALWLAIWVGAIIVDRYDDE